MAMPMHRCQQRPQLSEQNRIATSCAAAAAATHLDDLADVLWGHVLLGGLHEAELALVGVALGVQLLPFAGLRTVGDRPEKMSCDNL